MLEPAPVNQVNDFSAITPAGGSVGTPFDGGNPDTWPGVDGNASNNGNFLPYNSDNVVDPPVSAGNLNGGKKRLTRKRHHKKVKKAKKSTRGRKSMSKRRKSRGKKRSGKRKHIGKRKSRGKKRSGKRTTKKMRGGSSRDLLGMPLRNAYRNAMFGAGELVNNWNGIPTPISSDPNPSNQPLDGNTPFERSYVDLNAIGSSADKAVSNM